MNKNIIALYITKNGRVVAQKLKGQYKDELTVKKVRMNGLNKAFEEAFKYKKIVAIMATGIVVRAIANLIKSKKEDPAIVVVDELGKYVISLLSGHIGGANELAIEVAKVLDGQPIITTSSDVQGFKALDLYAKEKSYIISDTILYRRVAKFMTERKKIPVYIEKGEESYYFNSVFFEKYENIEDLLKKKGIKLIVSWRNYDNKDVLYLIPRKLVLGIGFHRGISGDELINFVENICVQENIHIRAIKKIATIDKRIGEKGLIELSKKLDAEISFFSNEELKKVENRIVINKTVEKYHGVGNVSEASAILGSNFGTIIVPKKKGGIITLCIALENCL